MTITVNAGEYGFEVNDVLAIADGNFQLNVGKEGFHAENNDDDSLGIFVIDAGSYTISASDDGINAAQKSTAYPMEIIVNGQQVTALTSSMPGNSCRGNMNGKGSFQAPDTSSSATTSKSSSNGF